MGRKYPPAVGLLACALVLMGENLYHHHMPGPDSLLEVRPRPKQVSSNRRGNFSAPYSMSGKGTALERSELKTRAISVKEQCSEMFGPDLNQTDMGQRPLNMLLVNDKYRLMFCYIPKVASSNLKRLFIVLGNFTKKRNTSDLTVNEVNTYFRKVKTLGSFSKKARLYRLKHYNKVLTSREPFERLVSAYHSKFQKYKDDPKELFAIKFRQKILTELSREGQTPETNLTFTKFIRFLVQEKHRIKQWDYHWAPYTDLCDPCHVGYDYVANFDTIATDMQLIIDDIGADVEFPRRPNSYKNVAMTSRSQLEAYYRNVPPEHIEQLRQIYSTDARLFGYTFPDILSKFVDDI